MQALKSSLGNKNFFRFIVSEFLYNICQTIIQMGIVYYVVTLLGLDKELTSILMMVMFVLSFVFYPFITAAAVKWEKKRVVIFGFALLALLFVVFSVYGVLPVSPLILAYITVGAAAIPIAIFTIVPNAIVADIAEADGIETGNFKAGMFFGVRSFESNLGVSVANILFPSLLLLGMSVENPFGIRMSAIVSVLICLAGLGVFFLYDEKAVLRSLAKKEKLSAGELRGIRADPGIGHWYLSFQDFRWKLVGTLDGVVDTLKALALMARGLREYEIEEREGDGRARAPGSRRSEVRSFGKWADYRLPLEAATQPAHPGRLGARSSLLALEAESLVFSSLRRSKAGALSLRFYDVLGTALERQSEGRRRHLLGHEDETRRRGSGETRARLRTVLPSPSA